MLIVDSTLLNTQLLHRFNPIDQYYPFSLTHNFFYYMAPQIPISGAVTATQL